MNMSIAKYLKPLCSQNNYIIRNTQEFAMSLKQQDLLLPDEEYVSYDVESLFTHVSVHESIDYILQEIYVKEKLPKICYKLIMKRLLLKLTTENTFMKQTNKQTFTNKLMAAQWVDPYLSYFPISI